MVRVEPGVGVCVPEEHGTLLACTRSAAPSASSLAHSKGSSFPLFMTWGLGEPIVAPPNRPRPSFIIPAQPCSYKHPLHPPHTSPHQPSLLILSYPTLPILLLLSSSHTPSSTLILFALYQPPRLTSRHQPFVSSHPLHPRRHLTSWL